MPNSERNKAVVIAIILATVFGIVTYFAYPYIIMVGKYIQNLILPPPEQECGPYDFICYLKAFGSWLMKIIILIIMLIICLIVFKIIW